MHTQKSHTHCLLFLCSRWKAQESWNLEFVLSFQSQETDEEVWSSVFIVFFFRGSKFWLDHACMPLNGAPMAWWDLVDVVDVVVASFWVWNFCCSISNKKKRMMGSGWVFLAPWYRMVVCGFDSVVMCLQLDVPGLISWLIIPSQEWWWWWWWGGGK